MKHVILVVLLAGISLFTSCSYLTDFVVINASDQNIQVRYMIKNNPGPFGPPVEPATISASELNSKGKQEWIQLMPSQFQLEVENRTVVVAVPPGKALRVLKIHHYVGHEDASDAENYPITEITVTGEGGELKEVGDGARTSFSKVSRALYTLTYK